MSDGLPPPPHGRAKSFYEAAGFRMDVDHVADENYRVVQFTPPGSEGSIIFGKGVTFAAPGSFQGLYLIVFGIEEARAELAGRDVGVSEVFDDAGGLFYHGHDAGEVVHHAGGRVAGPHPDRADGESWRGGCGQPALGIVSMRSCASTGRSVGQPGARPRCRGALEHPLSRRCRRPVRAGGHDLKDEDVAVLSPLKDRHINFVGRSQFNFAASGPGEGPRPLRDPDAPEPDEDDDGGQD